MNVAARLAFQRYLPRAHGVDRGDDPLVSDFAPQPDGPRTLAGSLARPDSATIVTLQLQSADKMNKERQVTSRAPAIAAPVFQPFRVFVNFAGDVVYRRGIESKGQFGARQVADGRARGRPQAGAGHDATEAVVPRPQPRVVQLSSC